MAEVIVDTLPIQYLHQLGRLIAPALSSARDLGPGELQVLSLALATKGAVVLLDDAAARRWATSLGLACTGTLGVLLDARRRGLIAEVGPLLDGLQELGFRLSPATRAAVLGLAGEVG